MRRLEPGTFVMRGGIRCRILGRRDCQQCGDKDSVIIHTGLSFQARETVAHCSRRCARIAGKNSPGRRIASSRKAVLELLAAVEAGGMAALDVAAAKIYDRAYKTGFQAGDKCGQIRERRRLLRLALQAKRERAQRGEAA